MAKKEDTYTHPHLQEKLKEDIKAADKSDRLGQGSARKWQFLTREHEKAQVGYKGQKTEDQRSLEKWTEEKWTTQREEEQSHHGHDMARCLPKEAWKKLSPEEREATETRRRKGSKKSEQYVENTEATKEARRETGVPISGYDNLTVAQIEGELEGLSNGELKTVRSYEKEHKNRKTLLAQLDRRIGYTS